MGNSHSDRYHNRSLVRFAKQMSAKRRELFSSQLKSSSASEAESWRVTLIEMLTHVEHQEGEGKWIEVVVAAIYEWDASLDIRWRENVKWFLVNNVAKAQDKQVLDRGSKWSIPGVPNLNIFKSTTITDFLEDHLKMTSSHGIAFLVDVFISYFIKEYQGSELDGDQITRRMRSDIAGFSDAAAEALRLYYGNIDIVGLLHRPESFLSLLVRSRILDDERVNSLFLSAITVRRKNKEAAFNKKLTILSGVSLIDINSETRPEFEEIAQKTGFASAVEKIVALTQVKSLKAKLDKIDLLQKSTVEEIDRYRRGLEPISLMADDMVTLFCFFILQARIPSLGSHIEMLTEMVHFEQMESITGYCLATLEGALLHLEGETA